MTPGFLPLLLRLWMLVAAAGLELIEQDEPELRCSPGLTDCLVSSVSPYPPADPDGAVSVSGLQLAAVLRCSFSTDCEPYLQISIALPDVNNAAASREESGDRNDEDELLGPSPAAEGSGRSPQPRALVIVCISSPGSDRCKKLQFKLNSSLTSSEQHQLLLTVRTWFGVPVVVNVHSETTHGTENITIPSLEEVCSMKLKATVKKCKAPRVRVVTDPERSEVVLHLETEGECQIIRKETGEVLHWPEGEREMILPSHYVVPCLCLQVSCKGMERRSEFCPFKSQQDAVERMRRGVSVSVSESQTREGVVGLSWTVTAPCRLEAEVRLCRKEVLGGRCEEVTGSTHRLQLQAGWRATRTGLWNTGDFNVSSHPTLCVQIKIPGMESYLEPQCPFTRSGWSWRLPLLIGLVFMCLSVLGAYLIQGLVKGYMWRWLKEEDVKGAVGGGHVVLLYLPDDEQALPQLMNYLGSSLQSLGFSVSLDLWSQAELGLLGPVPWLHSRLNRLQRQGGKVVLVLTQSAWIRAEEWGARSWERRSAPEGRKKEEEEAGRSYASSSPCVDVFTASLSCILADYLQGRAGQRFLLVQFESLPPEPPGAFRPLPELFRGLHLYSLPSQSLGFLTELAGTLKMATASARRRRAGGLRMASRALARGLSGLNSGTAVLRLPGVSQTCVGAGVEDSGETVPLQPCLKTPPSSPGSSSKTSDVV